MQEEARHLRLVQPGDGPGAACAGGLTELADALLAALATWRAQIAQLVEITERKLSAMRRADLEAMHNCLAAEAAALETVVHGERERRAILAALAQRLHLPPEPLPMLSQITAQLPEPKASLLRAKTLGLQDLAERLQKRNALAATVAQRLQMHLRAAVAEAAEANQTAVGYGPSGREEKRITRSWVDAVG